MRENTNKILDLLDEGVIDKDTFITAVLKYLSDDEVNEMAQLNGFFFDDDYDDDSDDDDDI